MKLSAKERRETDAANLFSLSETCLFVQRRGDGKCVCVCVCVCSPALSNISQTECALQKPLPRQLESRAAAKAAQYMVANYTLSLRMK